jgi:hypothetical protein
VPSDARGPHLVQVTFDTGPLAGKLIGEGKLVVSGK